MDQWQLLVCNIETLKQEHGRRKNSVAISSMSEVLQIRLYVVFRLEKKSKEGLRCCTIVLVRHQGAVQLILKKAILSVILNVTIQI